MTIRILKKASGGWIISSNGRELDHEKLIKEDKSTLSSANTVSEVKTILLKHKPKSVKPSCEFQGEVGAL